MRFWLKFAMVLPPLTAVGCQADIGTDDQMMSYSIGRNIGTTTGEHLDIDALIRGIEDARAELDPAVSEEDLAAAMQRVGQAIEEEQLAESTAAGEQNLVEGEEYLTSNATNEGVVTTDSGLQYEVLRSGDGPQPLATDQVRLHYRGTLIDGTEFDSSVGRGAPATFPLPRLIRGWQEGVPLMAVGDTFEFAIPADLAYGTGATGPIPGGATLLFTIELFGTAPAGG